MSRFPDDEDRRPPTPPHAAESVPESLTDEATRELLELALRRETGPFAPLLERLALPDGDTWFGNAIVRLCEAAGLAAPEFDSTVRGLDGLRRLKRFCRDELDALRPERPTEPAADRERHAAALAGYALSVAMARAQHGVILSARPREEWETLFRTLSELVSQPWSSHFLRAAGMEPISGDGR